MPRRHANVDVPRCVPDCELAHPRLAFETNECAQLHELIKTRREDETGVVRYLQRRLSQRQLGERAFTRATGQQLPAVVQVRPPDAEPFQLALLEVFPDESRKGEPQWCAGGYLLSSGRAPAYEWRVVDLAHVHFEEPFARGAGRLSRGWARLGALYDRLREQWRRRLARAATLPAQVPGVGGRSAAARPGAVASAARCACATPAEPNVRIEHIETPPPDRPGGVPEEPACTEVSPGVPACDTKASEALAS